MFFPCSCILLSNNEKEVVIINNKNNKNQYDKTHINTYRYQCSKTNNGFPISKNGNYESLLSFKELPEYSELKKTGRKWIYTKQYEPVMDRIFLDIDCDGDLNKAYEVTKQIREELIEYKDCINIYFSGSKGMHLEILTNELDIIDTNAEQPMNACIEYVEFLNYFQNKFKEVDLSLKDVGTRIIRVPHTKHEKTGNYKILIDINANLDDILTNSKKNQDMVEPAKEFLTYEQSRYLLDKFSKPLDSKDTPIKAVNIDNSSIYSIVFNELETNIHDKIGILGSGLNGYVDKSELNAIYNELKANTNIDDSTNAHQSFIDAFENDKMPCNLGALHNHYTKHKLQMDNFNALADLLNTKIQIKKYDEFNGLMIKHGSWSELLENELYDYVDNTENIFNAIIHCLMAKLGLGSRFIVGNGGSTVGKSEFINTIKKLIPGVINLGSSTPATIRRSEENKFNKSIVYLGDKGLKGTTDDFKELYEVFGGLITEKEFIRDVIENNKIVKYNLKSDGVVVFFTEPYTDLRQHNAGDQYFTRSTYITVNPVDDGLSVFLQDETKENKFYDTHKKYIEYIVKHPIELKITNEIKTQIYYASNGDLRTAKYLLALFKAYCQYLQIGNPLIKDVNEFLEVFKPQKEITNIEHMIYTKLYKNLNVLTNDELSYKLTDGRVGNIEDMLTSTKDRKSKSFFTAKQIATYFKGDFKANKNLKDTIEDIPKILKNLYNAGYIELVLEWEFQNQEVYYIPKRDEMENQ